MKKEHITELATLIFNVKQSINSIEEWKDRYIIRAMLLKIISDSNHHYSIEEIEQAIKTI